jgi:protein-arginine kinase
MMTDRDKLTVILIKILDATDLDEDDQEYIYNKITCGLSKVDIESYLTYCIKQIVNDEVIDASRN